MSRTDIVTEISNMRTEVFHLREKSDADDHMIALLKQQNQEQADEIVSMAAKHADEVRILKQRADMAIRNQAEVIGVLTTAAKGIMDGLRKMKGDNTPEIMPSAQARPADDPRLPPLVEDDMDDVAGVVAQLPPIEFRRL